MNASMGAAIGRSRRAWRTDLMDGLFIAEESLTWFALLRVVTTVAERAFLTSLADRVTAAHTGSEFIDRASADRALAAIEAARQASHGPSWAVVALAAFGGFYLIRGITRLGLDGALGAVVLLFVTVLGMNVIAHLAIVGDLRLWETSRVSDFLIDPNYFSGRVDMMAFIADPDLSGPHGAAISVTMLGLTVVWFRFAIAGRHLMTVERITTSFSVGFAFALVAMVGAALGGVDGVAPFVVLQFVGGVLALAVANHAKATAPAGGPMRPGPWLVAVGGTVGMLVLMAGILGLAALLNVQVFLAAVGGFALRGVEIALVIVITPIYWLMDFILRLLLPTGIGEVFDNLARVGANFDELREQQNQGRRGFPDWISNGAKFLAVLLIVWGLYRFARLLMTRRSGHEGPVVEVRTDATGGGGLGSFLRDLLPRGRRRAGDGWARRHPAYLLWRRAEQDGEERGFARLRGETAVEFAGRAEHAMEAPFPAVARVFDALRYGRHQPATESLVELDRVLAAWEVATPATPELRERLAGAAPLPEARDFALRIETAKRIAKGRAAPGEERPDRPPDAMI